MNNCAVYERNFGQFTFGQDFTIGNSLFGVVKLTKNADPDKNKYSDYGIGFNASGRFSMTDGGGFGRKVVIFGADTNSSVHIDNKKRYLDSW